MGKDGVSVPINGNENGRDEMGRFVPGHSIKSPGRPSKAQELAILDSIRSSFPPDVIRAKLQKALQLAEEQNSARGIVAVLEFAANYALGKPIQRTQEVQGGLASVLEELGLDD